MKKTEFENLKTNLPKTSRISDKIIEYYKKFGHERDLEKFMRFYSSASSQCSQEADNPYKGPMAEEFASICECSITSSNTEYSVHSSKSLPNLKIIYDKYYQLNADNVMDKTEESTPPKDAPNPSNACNQTPESTKKSHKRLEWDSLADIGYKRSTSHFNLNSIERSLLKNLFDTEQSRSNRNEAAKHVSVTLKPNITLPLACSTLADIEFSKQTSSTSDNNTNGKMPLQQQTTHSDAKVTQHDLLCNTSNEQELVTPSSFEFISNHSNQTNSPKPDSQFEEVAILNHLQFQFEKTNRKRITKSAYIQKLQNLRANLERAVQHNKENKSHKGNTSGSMESPLNLDVDIDLSIDVICSLIKAKALSADQKKKLIRNVVKRITRLSGGGDHGEISSRSLKSNDFSISGKLDESTSISQEAVVHLINVNEPNAAGQVSPSTRALPRSDQPTPNESTNDKSLRKTTTPVAIDSSTSSIESEQVIKVEVYTPLHYQKLNRIPVDYRHHGGSSVTDKPKSNQNTRCRINTANSMRNNDPAQGAEDATMYEWLNPMTQSELEYEAKQTGNFQPSDSGKKHSKELAVNCMRQEQLQWIENEIERLQCLKYLLLDKTSKQNSEIPFNSTEEHSNRSKLISGKSQATYDVVIEDAPNQSQESDSNNYKPSVDYDVVVIEAYQHETNSEENKKTDKQAHLRRDKSSTNAHNKETSDSKSQHHKCKDTLTEVDERLSNKEYTRPKYKQRDKIDTPSISTGSDSSNDIRQMVQQRKKEFLETYQAKKRLNYEVLRRRQRQHLLTNLSNDIEASNHVLYFAPITQSNANPSDKPQPTHFLYSTATTTNRQMKIVQRNSGRTTTSKASASIFRLTSKISLPMGTESYVSSSLSTSSTPTHHYDDVTVDNIAVQTTASILRSKPMYGKHFDIIHKEQSNQLITESSSCYMSETRSVQFKADALQAKPNGISYVIEFINQTPTSSTSTGGCEVHSAKPFPCIPNLINADLEEKNELEKNSMTLQERLEKSKPQFVKNTKQRSAILSEMQAMRQERTQQLRAIIDTTNVSKLDTQIEQQLPPPPTQRIRVLNTKEMKALTKKRVSKLPEVVAKQQREQEERLKRNNRILRDLFNKRLQQRVRNGKLSLTHSQNIV